MKNLNRSKKVSPFNNQQNEKMEESDLESIHDGRNEETKTVENRNNRLRKPSTARNEKENKISFLPDSHQTKKRKNIDTTDESKMSKWARIKFKEFDYEFSDKKTNHKELSIKMRVFRAKFKSFLKQIEKLDPWYKLLNYIERTFGSSYLAFFKFIQWLFVFNLIISIISLVFVILPQIIYDPNILLPNQTYLDEEYNGTFDIGEECPIILKNRSIINIFKNRVQKELLLTNCCTTDYKTFLTNEIERKNSLDTFLDFFQGTGFIEDTLLFYGHYNNRSISSDGKQVSHVYYMGIAFVTVSLISLLISAVLIIKRLGKGFKNGIIKSSKSQTGMELCHRIFCSLDYHITNKKFSKHSAEMIERYLNDEILEINKLKEKRKLKLRQRLPLYTIRFSIFTLILALFCASGYGIYALNELSVKSIDNTSEYETLFFEYLPAIGIKVLNLIFPFICFKLARFEQYSAQQSLTLYLMRTGIVRLGSFIFLFISISINVFDVQGFCSSQRNTIFSNSSIFVSSSTKNSTIKCWETYVGQQFYKLVVLDFITQFLNTFVVETLAYQLSKISCFKFFTFIPFEFDLGIRFLDLLYIQTIFWSAFFFSPILSVVATVYYFLIFYMRLFSLRFSCKVSTNTEMQTKQNSAFYAVLFFVFLFVLIAAGLIFSAVKPSRSCGPFRIHDTADFSIYDKIREELNTNTHPLVKYIFNIIFSYLFILLLSCLLLIVTWILYNYKHAYATMANQYRKIINEEKNKNKTLLKKVSKLEAKVNLKKSQMNASK